MENKELMGKYELSKREFKFRGKSLDTGERIYGYLIQSKGKSYIVKEVMEHIKRDDYVVYMVEVENGSVGQYNGLKDKNGVDVYEGDIVKFYSTILEKYLIEYVYFSKRGGFYLGDIFINDVSEIEVIGNVFENPELLEA